MDSPDRIEEAAKAIYWAAFELYPVDPKVNPVGRMSKDKAWERTSEEHRTLARYQARKAQEIFAG